MRFPYVKMILLFLLIFCLGKAQVTLVEAFPGLSFSRPVDLQHAPDGSNRIFVVSQQGRIYSFENDSSIASAHTFLDITDSVSRAGNEEGLLGLAFHPEYQNNGYFYVYYSKINDRRSIIARYSVSSENADSAILNSQQIIMNIEQPARNHNGGQLAFGPDGYLYISLGDGGSGGDPWGSTGNGQNLETLLGSILRINVNDISQHGPYAIPPDNPFAGNGQNYREEIFAYGLRNPWRFSFDPVTGWLWAGDVGQGNYEEIDIIESGNNYGWRIMEANHCYNAVSCSDSGLTYPIWEYDHGDGISITGGHVYRGSKVPYLYGKYIYTDYGTSLIWTLEYDSLSDPVNQSLFNSEKTIVAFGVDQNYEMYACAFDGKIYKFQQKFDLDQVELISPPDRTELPNLQSFKFKWNNVTRATSYIFQLATDSLFFNIVYENTPSADSLEIEGLQPAIDFYWRVAAIDSQSNGEWSDTWNFIIQENPHLSAPILLRPINNQIIYSDTVIFLWSSVAEAQNYKIEISDQYDFIILTADSVLTDSTISMALDDQQGKKYYWRVRALENNIEGPWSEIQNFEIGLISENANFQNPIYSFRLEQNFPNPFNPQTRINYQLKTAGTVLLAVYNIKGERVKLLVNKKQSAGIYTVNFDGAEFASGLYFCRLQTGAFTQVRRMLLIK